MRRVAAGLSSSYRYVVAGIFLAALTTAGPTAFAITPTDADLPGDCSRKLQASVPLTRSIHAITKVLESKPTVETEQFQIWEVYPGVVFFYFKTQDELTRTFLRFQEHYESPKFRNQIFSLEEFVDWYKTTQEDGEFSYYTDWAGFNFPSFITDPFYDGRFTELTDREQRILSALESWRGHKFYVIGAYARNKSPKRSMTTILHETAHSLFYMNESYRAQAQEIVSKLPREDIERMSSHLGKIGYTPEVFEDEIHAYLTANWQDFVLEGHLVWSDRAVTVIQELNALFEAQFPLVQ